MHDYTEKRLQKLRNMSTEEVAACKVRASTPPRIKSIILQAREKMKDGDGGDDGKAQNAPHTKLKNGDVLLMRNHGTFFQNLISGVTRSPYVHAAVYSKGKVYDSLNSTGGLKNKGGNINTFQNFAGRDKGITYDVFRPKDQKVADEAIRNVEHVTLNTKGYSNANAIQAGLRDRFGYGITTNYDKNYKICSELVYDCFNGHIGNDASSSVTPGRLARNKHLEKVDTLRLSIEELL
jgi:hypothetical protein